MKFKNNYSNNLNDNDVISYESFINLYCLYMFDIYMQSVINIGIANIRIKFNFNSAVPGTTEAQVDLYCV